MAVLNVGVLHYWLDYAYGTLMHRLRVAPPFFSAGWGGPKLELLERLTRQLIGQGLAQVALQRWPPPPIRPAWRTVWESRTACLREGAFPTPCDPQLRDALPPESRTTRVALLTPRGTPPSPEASCVIHLAGTGDHGFRRRLKLAGLLLKNGISSIVLESPFYGQRRPRLQRGAKLLCASDLLLLGRATIEESRALLYWMEKAGFNKLGVCGLSMGGVHAAMVGSLHPTPLAILPLLAPHSAAVAFCEGIFQYATAWDALMHDKECSAGMTLEQVRERMRSILSLTDVTQFPIPVNPSAVIFVAATDDGYIPRHSVLELQHAWPGSEVRWVTGGHVSSIIFHNKEFQCAITDAIGRL